MGGDQRLSILVMVVLAILLVGTFVLRPAPSALSARDGRIFYYVVRLGIVLFGLMYGSHHGPHPGPRYGAGGAADSFLPTPGHAGSKTMEFHWPATQRSR